MGAKIPINNRFYENVEKSCNPPAPGYIEWMNSSDLRVGGAGCLA
jgi:hypothetical protein